MGSMTNHTTTMGITDKSGTQKVFQDLFVHDSVQIASTWLKNVINDSKKILDSRDSSEKNRSPDEARMHY
jgi:hypothetical protein